MQNNHKQRTMIPPGGKFVRDAQEKEMTDTSTPAPAPRPQPASAPAKPSSTMTRDVATAGRTTTTMAAPE
eukprot:3580471-Pleurochrysis_carterae.AAC.1